MPYILAAICLWSSLGIIIRLSTLPLTALIFFPCAVSCALIGALLSKRQYRHGMPRLKVLSPLLIVGPLSLINTFSFYYAYKNTSIANAVLTHYTAPIVVAFLAPLFLKERLTVKVFASIVIATAGLWIMLGVSYGDFMSLIFSGDKNMAGILAGLLSGIAYALLIIVLRVLSRNFNPLIMTFVQNSVIALILLPFLQMPVHMGSALWLIAVMGIVHSTIAPILYYKGIGQVSANRAAVLGYLEPVCAIALGILFLKEAIAYKTFIGGLLIIFSGYLTIRDALRQKS